MLMDIVRNRDSVLLSKVSTLRGFAQIYKDILSSQKDPRRKLLYFSLDDIRKVVPVDVTLTEDHSKFSCNVEVFFMCMRYLDDVIDASKEGNVRKSSLPIYQDIRNVETLLRKGRRISQQSCVPPSEKVVYTEGFLRLYSTITADQPELSDWRVDFFKFSNFNIVPVKIDEK